MQISKRFFPEILLENEITYFSYLEGIISSIDEYASMETTKSLNSYNFRIVPSLPKYNKLLLEEILKLHNMFHIKLDIGKSIKTSCTINFSIELFEN